MIGASIPRFVMTLASALILAAPVGAQTLPMHVDPSARETVPDLSSVPALRFLTTTDFPPFNYRDGSGELIGFNIDLAQAICARLSARCTIQAWPWEQAQEALLDNQGDALIAGLAITEESGNQFDFSHIYLALPGRFVIDRDTLGSFDPDRLDGPVAVREGGAHQTFLARHLPRIETQGHASELEALEAMQAGDAAAFFGDGMRASFWLNENGACCDFAGEAYFHPPLFGEGLAIALPVGLDRVRTAIDWALVRLQREGRLDELYLRWFPISFY